MNVQVKLQSQTENESAASCASVPVATSAPEFHRERSEAASLNKSMNAKMTEKAKQETQNYIARIEKLGKGASHKQLFRLQQAKEMLQRFS